MKVIINGKQVGTLVTNHRVTDAEIMYCAKGLGYDIDDPEDCKRGYDDGIEGFFLDDCGNYCFDPEADIQLVDE